MHACMYVCMYECMYMCYVCMHAYFPYTRVPRVTYLNTCTAAYVIRCGRQMRPTVASLSHNHCLPLARRHGNAWTAGATNVRCRHRVVVYRIQRQVLCHSRLLVSGVTEARSGSRRRLALCDDRGQRTKQSVAAPVTAAHR